MDWSYILMVTLIGFFGGIISGGFGVGGGVLIVPALVFIMGYSQQTAQGTFLAMMVPPLAFFSAYNYWKAGHVDIKTALWLILPFIIGSIVGSYVSNHYISGKILRQLFGVVMLITALKMIFSK